MLGRIHGEQHHPHAFERLGCEVLEHDAGLVGREEVRLLGDADDIGMLEHRPVPGLVGHVLPVHGLRAPQLGEDLVRRPVGVGVRVVDVDGRRHGYASNGPRPIWSRTVTTGGLVSERRCQFAPSTTSVWPEMKRA